MHAAAALLDTARMIRHEPWVVAPKETVVCPPRVTLLDHRERHGSPRPGAACDGAGITLDSSGGARLQTARCWRGGPNAGAWLGSAPGVARKAGPPRLCDLVGGGVPACELVPSWITENATSSPPHAYRDGGGDATGTGSYLATPPP